MNGGLGLGFGEMVGEDRWYNLELSGGAELDGAESDGAESEDIEHSEDSDGSETTQSAVAHLRCGDLVVFLNSLGEHLTFEEGTQHMLFIALFLICYKRELFPMESFKDIYVPSLAMRIKGLVPAKEGTSLPFICFLKGLYEAVGLNYARELWVRVMDEDREIVEEYVFSLHDVEEQEGVHQQGFRSLVSNMIQTVETLLWGFRPLHNWTLFVNFLIHAPTTYEPKWFKNWEQQQGEFPMLEEESQRIQELQRIRIPIRPVGLTLLARSLLDDLDDGDSTDDEDDGDCTDDGNDEDCTDDEDSTAAAI